MEEASRQCVCAKCRCRRFAPCMWGRTLCKFCYHSVEDHDLAAPPAVQVQGWRYAQVEGPFPDREMRKKYEDGEFKDKMFIFHRDGEDSFNTLESLFDNPDLAFKMPPQNEGMFLVSQMVMECDGQQCYYKDDNDDEQGPFEWEQIFEWHGAGYFQGDRLVRSANLETFVPLQIVVDFYSKEQLTKKGDWEQRLDTMTSKMYWCNVKTNQTQWETPDFSSPDDWEILSDPDTGKEYFWNRVTNDSTWERPAVLAVPAPPPPRRENPPTLPASKAATGATKGRKGGGKKARQQIIGESLDVNQFKTRSRNAVHKEETEMAAIMAVLDQQEVFMHMKTSDKEALADAMTVVNVTKDEDIIKQGDTGDFFYVVKEGNFHIFVNGNKVAETGAGKSFGELALMFNCPRAATVRASEDSVVWALDRLTFRGTLAVQSSDALNARKATLQRVHLLKELSPQQLGKIVVAITEKQFAAGERILQRGDMGDEFYMIKKGRVKCTDFIHANLNDVFLSDGDYFGERALLRNEPRAASVFAEIETTVFLLSKNDFVTLLGPLSELLNRNHCQRVLRSMPQLHALTGEQIGQLASNCVLRELEGGAVVFKRGDAATEMFIVREGAVELQTSAMASAAVVLGAGQFFGEECLGEGAGLVYSSSASVQASATNKFECFSLSRESFEKELGPVSEALSGKGASAEGKATAEKSKSSRPVIRAEDLQQLATLGAGTFGIVKLVRHKPTGVAYAVKMLSKQKIFEMKQQANVMREKQVLWELDHPFVLRLVATFKDPCYLSMMLELVQGGELYAVLCREEFLETPAAKFYAASVLCGLSAIHDLNYAYRDLKPENLMLDKAGFLKIVDFGFAKKVEPGERTWTLCGTPEYLAPEIVACKGYDKSVDWWAMGILIFEMLCGYSPFSDPDDNQMKIFKNVLRARLEFPDDVEDELAKDLISKLICRDCGKRLGALKNGSKDIFAHPWFGDINFDDLVGLKVTPPWVPELKDDTDLACFDTETLEEEEAAPPFEDDGSNWDADF